MAYFRALAGAGRSEGAVAREIRLGSVEESAEIMGWLIAHARDQRLL